MLKLINFSSCLSFSPVLHPLSPSYWSSVKLDFKRAPRNVLQKWDLVKRLEISVIRSNVFREVQPVWLARLDKHNFTSVSVTTEKPTWEQQAPALQGLSYHLLHHDHQHLLWNLQQKAKTKESKSPYNSSPSDRWSISPPDCWQGPTLPGCQPAQGCKSTVCSGGREYREAVVRVGTETSCRGGTKQAAESRLDLPHTTGRPRPFLEISQSFRASAL